MATIIVKQDGTGNATTIQDGLNLAANGDVVEIQDSGTYNEAVAVPAGLQNVTLQVAEGQTPTWTSTTKCLTVPADVVGFTVQGPQNGGFSLQPAAGWDTVELQGTGGLTLRRLTVSNGAYFLRFRTTSPGGSVTVEDSSVTTTDVLIYQQVAQVFHVHFARCTIHTRGPANLQGLGKYIGDLVFTRCRLYWRGMSTRLGDGPGGEPALQFVNCTIRHENPESDYLTWVIAGAIPCTAIYRHSTLIRGPELAVGGTAIYGAASVDADIRNVLAYRFDTGLSWAGNSLTVGYNHMALCTTPYQGTPQPATDVDPTLDPLFVDPANDDFHLQVDPSLSPDIDAGIDLGVTEDLDGTQRPIGPAPDIGAYEALTEKVTGVEALAPDLVAVHFNMVVTDPSFEDPSAWGWGKVDKVADQPDIKSITGNGSDTAYLYLDDHLTEAARYQVRVPQSFPLLPSGLDWQTFTVRTFGPDPTGERGFLEAFTAAIGRQFAKVAGAWETRLTRQLAPGDDHILVESTHGLPESCVLGIGNETIWGKVVSARKIAVSLRSRFITHPAGARVIDLTRQSSLLDEARRQLHIATAPQRAMVEWIASKEFGLPAPYSWLDKEAVRGFVLSQTAYRAGSWTAVYKALELSFRMFAQSGTQGTVTQSNWGGWFIKLPEFGGPLDFLPGRVVHLADVNGVWHEYMIVAAQTTHGVATAQLAEVPGPFWESAPGPFVDGQDDIAWRLDPFRLWFLFADLRPNGEFLVDDAVVSGPWDLSDAVFLNDSASDNILFPGFLFAYQADVPPAEWVARRLHATLRIPNAWGNSVRAHADGAGATVAKGGYARLHSNGAAQTATPGWFVTSPDYALRPIAPVGVEIVVWFLGDSISGQLGG